MAQHHDFLIENKADVAALAKFIAKNGGASIRVFAFDKSGKQVLVPASDVDRLLSDMAGKATDATREPENRASSFPGSASIVDRTVGAGDDSVMPLAGYEMTEPDPVTRLGYGYTLPGRASSGLATPLDFNAPTPGKNPADGPAPEQLNGMTAVMKSATIRGRMGVSFTDIVKMEPGDLQYGQG
jgi:hypothetical protein